MAEKSGESSLQLSLERNKSLGDRLMFVTLEKQGGGEHWLQWRDPNLAQQIADETYGPQYENDKKQIDASKDIKGRPVTYWRSMSIEAFLKILKNGEITSMDYHRDVLDDEDKKQLQVYLADYDRYLKYESGIKYYGKDFDQKRAMSALDLARYLFPKKDPDELEKLFLKDADVTWTSLMRFLDENLEEGYIKGRHAGGVMKRFSPFLSLSIATPRESVIDSTEVIVEFVVPDSTFIFNDRNGAVGEREFLAKKLKSNWIARVYIDTNVFYKDFVNNPDTPMGQYKNDSENKEAIRSRGSVVESFRWDVPISETLPASGGVSIT